MPPTVTTFLFEAANFLVLVAFLAWLFFRPVKNALDRRREEQQRLLTEATEKLTEVERMRIDIQQQHAVLAEELDAKREKATAAAEQEAAEIIKQARDAARQEVEREQSRIASLSRTQQDKLARVIADVASASVDRLLRTIEQPELNDVLTTAACREIRALEDCKLAPVRVESARPLDSKNRQSLLSALGTAADATEFHVIEDLGVGLRVATNCGLIDVSAAGLAKFARHKLAAELTWSGPSAVEGSDG